MATRRIRELLALADGPSAEAVRDRVKRIGRALGKARDADVRMALLVDLESRIPPAAPMLVTLRQAHARQRLKRVRSMIKRTERLEIEKVLDHLLGKNLRSTRHPLRTINVGWRNTLHRALVARAQRSIDAIEHATGVYFPNRAHAARIALKQLRYAMEIAAATRAGDFTAPLSDLRKGQGVLGDLHDRESLLEHLSSKEWTDPREQNSIDLIRQVLKGEIQQLHSRYLNRRTQLLYVSRSIHELREHRRWGFPSLVTAGAVALSSGIYVAQRRMLGPSTNGANDYSRVISA